ncbi:TPA: helix-turn-helix domain-containing protein [Bacillus cereus]|nr:helix-turn-helix domain-containing protein [Bacillus cereus]
MDEKKEEVKGEIKERKREEERKAEEEREREAGIIVSWEKREIRFGNKKQEIGEHLGNEDDFDKSIDLICELVKSCYILMECFNVEIRWFSYVDEVRETLIKNNIYAINCELYDKQIVPYGSKGEVIYNMITNINRESLVFRYNEATGSLPNVLFTADSSFEFSIKETPSKGEETDEEEGNMNHVSINSGVSIVTTPHHGSANDKHKDAYENLKGKDFIFVRSSERHKGRPSEHFQKHPKEKRFCVRCGPPNGKWRDEQKIRLEFMNGEWRAKKGVESCKCTDDIEGLLSTSEVQDTFTISKSKIERMIKDNKLKPVTKVGKINYFSYDDVVDALLTKTINKK